MNDQKRGNWTSASNALADRLCRGRHQAQIGLPELPETEESDTGSLIHALWTGTPVSREAAAAETEKAEALCELEKIVAELFFGERDGTIRIVEHRLWHEFPAVEGDPERGALKTSGQFDVALVQAESCRALILDGKSGWLSVSPNPLNLQLRRLAALLWLQLGCSEIGVCMLKPFAKAESPCVYTVPDLHRSVCEMEEDVRLSHESGALRTAGEEQCRYCRARESCPTRFTWLSGALPAAFPLLPAVSARDWNPAQRVLFLEREKDARDWLDKRKEEIKAMLGEVPQAVPGYGLKPGRTVETITDSQEVWRRFSEDCGGTLEAFLKCIKVGKTAFKDEVRAASGLKGKALETALEQLLAGCVECKTSAPTIEKLK